MGSCLAMQILIHADFPYRKAGVLWCGQWARKCPPSCSSKIMVSLAMQILGGHEMIHRSISISKCRSPIRIFFRVFSRVFSSNPKNLKFSMVFLFINSSMKSLSSSWSHRSTSTDPAQFLSMSAPQWSIAGAKWCEISWLSWLYWQDGAAKIAFSWDISCQKNYGLW